MVTNRKDHASYRKPMTLRAAAWVCCLGLLLCVSPARAGVTWSGNIMPADPTLWTPSVDGYVSYYSVGTMDITAGGTVSSRNGYIGYQNGSDGTVTVDGAGSTWANSGRLYLGREWYGTGALNITDGGVVSNTDGYIGYESYSFGTVTVDGVGSRWASSGELQVGRDGDAEMLITNGGWVSCVDGFIGEGHSLPGAVTVNGVGSRWTNSDDLRVDGNLSITGGGLVTNDDGWVGDYDVATIIVDGAGSRWNMDALIMGIDFDATLTVSNGATVSTDYGRIEYNNSYTYGTVTVGGTGSNWTSTGILEVDGELNINAGGAVSNTDAYISYDNTSDGMVRVDGADASWTNSGDLYVGYYGSRAGTLEITNGGTVSSGKTYLGDRANATGTVTVDGVGSTWTSTDDLYVGAYGTGVLTITGGGTVTTVGGASSGYSDVSAMIGQRAGSSGTVTVDGVGSTWTTTENLWVARDGTGVLNITNGGSVTVEGHTWVSAWDGSGTISFNNGTLSTSGLLAAPADLTGTGTISATGLVSDVDLVFDSTHGLIQSLVLNAEPGQNITVNLDVDGTGTMGAGLAGTGSLTISDGLVVSSTDGYLGFKAGSSGTATVDGAGSSWISNDYLYVGHYGDGDLNITNGGTVSNTTTVISYQQGSSGTVSVDGVASALISSNGVDVGDEDVGVLTITNGGTVSTGGSTIASDGSSSGTATVDGAGSTWLNTGNLTVGRNGTGVLNIRNGGLVTAGNETKVGWRDNGSGTINFDSGTLTTGSLLAVASDLTGTGTVNANGLVTDADLIFDATHGLIQTVTLNAEPGQDITVNLDVDGTGAMGAGAGGSGSISISDGVAVNSTDGYLGYKPGSSGTATVDGAGSSWANAGALTVGDDGAGVLTITNGAAVSNTYGYVGKSTGSSGTVTVDGAGSTWTNAGDLALRNSDGLVLSVTNGGAVYAVDSTLGGSGAANALVSGVGSTWMNSGDLDVYSSPSAELFIIGGGLVTVGGELNLGGSSSTGDVRMSSGAMLALAGDADGSIQEFLDLVAGSDGIHYRDVINNGWLDIAGGIYGVDYNLAYMSAGYLAGHTVLTVDGVAPVNGDFNGDGASDADDVDLIAANFGGDPALYDLDGDGDVDVDDMIFFVENYLEYDANGDGTPDGQGTFLGDSNTDGVVDGTDLSILSGSFGGSTGFAGGDANGDGSVNGTDLSILSSTFGSVATAAVPEPMTMSMLALGACLPLLRKRR